MVLILQIPYIAPQNGSNLLIFVNNHYFMKLGKIYGFLLFHFIHITLSQEIDTFAINPDRNMRNHMLMKKRTLFAYIIIWFIHQTWTTEGIETTIEFEGIFFKLLGNLMREFPSGLGDQIMGFVMRPEYTLWPFSANYE